MSVKFAAYTQVCQKFLDACDEAGVHPQDCLLAIWRFLCPESIPVSGLPPVPAASSATSPIANQVQVQPNKVTLTKEQVEEAKKEARSAKAKRLGVSLNEVNLTPKEAKEAKVAMRERIAKGTQPPLVIPATGASPTNATTGAKKNEPPVKVESPRQGQKDQQDLSVPIGQRNQAPQTGARATAKTRIDNFRRACLRANPALLAEPTVLHLVAYSNHYNRLLRQWDDFVRTYGSAGVMNPLRDLPNLGNLKRSASLISNVTSRLREQPDSPGTYALQNDNGGSYWDRDKPGKDCPDFLCAELPREVIQEIELASGAVN